MISFSEKAMLRAREVLKDQEVMRIAVMGGGCSGLQYHIASESINTVSDRDNVFDCGGFQVAIDPKSMVYLAGSEIEYEEVFGGGRFVVNNPNASRTCGCGKSFS